MDRKRSDESKPVRRSVDKVLSSMALIAIMVGLIAFSVSGSKGAQNAKIEERDTITQSEKDRILVIAPHPDDETLAPGATIRQALIDKIPVQVVVMTCGDSYREAAIANSGNADPTGNDYIRLGEIRHQESINAMAKLGLASDNIQFLGYPNGYIDFLFDVNWDDDNLVTGKTGRSSTPYSFAYEKKAPYCGKNVVENLTKIINDFEPTIIIYPSPNDIHADHWATGAFVHYTTSMLDYDAEQYTYLIHRSNNWPSPPYYRPDRSLDPPDELLSTDAIWIKVAVTDEESLEKKEAISLYSSQNEAMKPFLSAFIRKNELYSKYPSIEPGHIKNTPELFSYDSPEGKILVDPVSGGILEGIAGIGDMKNVWFLEGMGKTWFVVETIEGIKSDLIYSFSMRIFKERDVERLDIRVCDDKVKTEMMTGDSIKPRKQVMTENKNKRLVVELPSELFNNARSMLVNVSTFQKDSTQDNWIDRTTWRQVDLQE